MPDFVRLGGRILAGLLWGDWTALQAVRSGLACLGSPRRSRRDDDDALDEAESRRPPPNSATRATSSAGRRSEAWLERRGLSVEAWLDFNPPRAADRALGHDLEEIREEYEPDEDEVAAAVVCDALCGGLAADWRGASPPGRHPPPAAFDDPDAAAAAPDNAGR